MFGQGIYPLSNKAKSWDEGKHPVYRIYLVGMGNAPVAGSDEDAKTKHISGGRVEISLLKNDLEQLSSNSAAPVISSDQQQQPK